MYLHHRFLFLSVLLVFLVGPSRLLAQQPDSIATRTDSTAILQITSDPPGANVLLDDQMVGHTPLKREGLHPGRARLQISLGGYDSWLAEVDLVGGQTQSLNVRLVRSHVNLMVLTDRSDSRVYVDGKDFPVGTANGVISGSHRVRVVDDSLQRAIEEDFLLGGQRDVVLQARIGNRSWSRVAVGTLLPGVIQMVDKSPVQGVAFLAAACGSFVYLSKTQSTVQDRNDTYTGARGKYVAASSEQQASAARSALNTAYDDLNSATKQRNVAIGIVAAVFIANVIDVFLHHSIIDEIEVVPVKETRQAQAQMLPVRPGVPLVSVSVPLSIGGH